MPICKPPLGLARKLRDDVDAVTGGRPMRWMMVDELWLRHPNTSLATLDAALALAIDKGLDDRRGDAGS